MLWCLVPLLALWAGGCAQPTPQQMRRGRRRPRLFRITDIGAEVFIEGEYDSEETTTTRGAKSEEKGLVLREGIDTDLAGFIYDPRLLLWTAGLGFSFAQERTEINGVDRDSDGTLNNYDISALILKEKPVALRLWASQTENLLDRDLTRRTELRTESEGVQVFTKGRFPASLMLEHTEIHEESEFRTNDTESDLLRFDIADRRDRNWLTEFTFEREDTERVATFGRPETGLTTTTLPEKRKEATVNNSWKFGRLPWEAELTGRMNYRDQEGFFNQRTITGEQHLELAHTDTFGTFYDLSYLKDETDVQDDEVIRAEVGARKSIYSSLDITGRLTRRNSDYTTGSSDLAGWFLALAYRKSTPIGHLTSDLLLGRTREEEESSTGTRLITDEPHVLVGFDFVALDERDVVPGSMIVTNVAETILYIRGFDYSVRTTGAVTEIARLISGDIASGQTVLVDYVVAVPTDATIATDLLAWNTAIDLKSLPLVIYYRRREREESLDSGTDPGNLEDETVNVIGMEATIGNVVASLEHEDHDRQLSPPTVADRFRVDYRRRLGRDVSLGLNGYAESMDFKDADEFGLGEGGDHQETYVAGASLTARLRSNLLLSFNGEAHRSEGREQRESFGLGVILQGRYREIDFTVEMRHDEIQQESNETNRNVLRFSVRRLF